MTDEERPVSDRLARQLETYRAREERARKEPPGTLWRTLGRVGALGWLIVLPAALGAWLGHALDRRLHTRITWALGFLILGLAAGAYTVWRTISSVHEEEEGS